jgi:hypothetical protein
MPVLNFLHISTLSFSLSMASKIASSSNTSDDSVAQSLQISSGAKIDIERGWRTLLAREMPDISRGLKEFEADQAGADRQMHISSTNIVTNGDFERCASIYRLAETN